MLLVLLYDSKWNLSSLAMVKILRWLIMFCFPMECYYSWPNLILGSQQTPHSVGTLTLRPSGQRNLISRITPILLLFYNQEIKYPAKASWSLLSKSTWGQLHWKLWWSPHMGVLKEYSLLMFFQKVIELVYSIVSIYWQI